MDRSAELQQPESEQAWSGPSDGLTPEIMAVIHEAVRAFTGKRMRIVSVKRASELRDGSKVWASEGLNLQHESHNRVQRGR